ncbi:MULTISPECIES: hypothetical protein [unclassified Flavobacterium]|uniref:YobI family P-loop NTPase n=2 Tax=Flavobacterium TaxID=237 RepID=UPI0006ABA0E3|nr:MULTISPECIES: hypothetical protein [unclassified Flavobacterium]KOP37208.1 hypothetical protein AKO67_15645 [Flavobacterium sp. VMW]OWU88720.1 hypothetical protein APR43_20965 [Flavobacterium sp. NLM]
MNKYKKCIKSFFIKLKNSIFGFFLNFKKSILNSSFYVYLTTIISNFLNKIICYFKKKRNSFDRSLGYPLSKNPNGFEDLTPSIIENEKIYIDSLYWALTNSNITNVALTGSYGSGKSSILKTLKIKHKEFDYLSISLATFEEQIDNIDNEKPKTLDEINENKKRREELNQKIELSILQQMLYLEKSISLPNSRFKRIRNLKSYSLVIFTIIGFFVALSFAYLFYQDLFKKLIIFSSISKESKGILELTSLAIFICGSLFIVKSFIKSLYHFRFEKINLKGDIELNREIDNNSILNKNLDEIIYFFEKTNYNVVLIEDLDRFKEPEIFTKLREINLILNNSKQIGRHITFIYALKDEMFKDGNRTKFFDFIVPVIPIINPSNSYDLLHDKLKNEGINDQLLDDISLYVDDMRLLKNIVNEFKIYKEKLTIIDLDKSKLLSFIIYKNKYPEDFAKLHYNKGMIYSVFNEDEQKIKRKQILDEETEIKRIRLKIEEISDFGIDSIENLRRLYILKIIENFPSSQKITTLNLDKSYPYNDVEQLITDSAFENLTDRKSINYTYQNYDYNYRRWDNINENLSVSFNDIEEQIGAKHSYFESKSLINENTKESIDVLKFELFNCENNIKVIRDYSIQELIRDSSKGLNKEIIKEDILIYFLRNGLIDQDYWYYISLFHETEDGLSKNDQNYILGIRNNKPRELTYKLNNIKRILKKINDDFDKEIILNLDLVEYIFEKKNNETIKELFSLFQSTSVLKTSFIKLYINQGKNIDLFIEKIAGVWSGFWDYIEADNFYLIEKKDKILIRLLQNLKGQNLIKQNSKGNLLKYISNKTNFLILMENDNVDTEKIIENLVSLKVKFIDSLEIGKNKSLFNLIYENDLYELNETMIEFVFKNKAEDVNDLKVSNYSTIQNSQLDLLKLYVENNIEKYISNVFLSIETNTNETELGLVKLLNNQILKTDIKLKIIEDQNIKISTFLNLQFSVWPSLLALDKVEPTWDNLINYSLKYEFDEYLILFLNNLKNAEKISKLKINDSKFDDSTKNKFTREILEKDELNENSYFLILDSVTQNYNELNLEEINDIKIQKLIEKKIIAFSKENFDLVKEASHDNIQLVLVELNFREYLKVRDEFLFELIEYEYLLKSDKLSLDNKIDLIYELDATSLDVGVSNIVAEILSVNKMISIDYEFLLELITNSKNVRNKILLFNKYFTLFKNNIESLESVLVKLGNPYSEITQKWKEIKFTKNDLNTAFINNLKSIRYTNISSDKLEDNYIKIVTKRK